MKKIRQAVIPAAGLGTRFFPTTKCFPKELIPLLDKPCLQHVLDEAIASGIEEFVIVISPEKRLIEDYFKPNDHINSWLKKQGKTEIFESLKKIENQAKIQFVYQEQPLGLGHAVLCAKDYITDDSFFVILPDDVIASDDPVCHQMISIHNETNLPVLSVMEVPWEKTDLYGIVKAVALTDRLGQIEDVVEKPKRNEAPSNLAVIGRYILPRNIFSSLDETSPGAGGEIQLTDAIRDIIVKQGMNSYMFAGDRFDTGTPLGWVKANIALSLKDAKMKNELIDYVKLLASGL